MESGAYRISLDFGDKEVPEETARDFFMSLVKHIKRENKCDIWIYKYDESVYMVDDTFDTKLKVSKIGRNGGTGTYRLFSGFRKINETLTTTAVVELNDYFVRAIYALPECMMDCYESAVINIGKYMFAK